jgi:hypothetical protein
MSLLATAPPRPPFEWVPLLAMLLVLGASVLMYVMLVRRWTSRRQWVSLAQWARESGFRARPLRRADLPRPLQEVVRDDAQVRFHLCDPRTTLVQFETDPLKPGVTAAPKWNVLVRHRPAAGPAAGLRPAAQVLNLIDLLPLSKFPSMSLGDRFVVYATDPAAARTLAQSQAVALLPPDIGFMLLENHVVLDFSNRPFDPIEFGRVIALADQLARVVS